MKNRIYNQIWNNGNGYFLTLSLWSSDPDGNDDSTSSPDSENTFYIGAEEEKDSDWN